MKFQLLILAASFLFCIPTHSQDMAKDVASLKTKAKVPQAELYIINHIDKLEEFGNYFNQLMPAIFQAKICNNKDQYIKINTLMHRWINLFESNVMQSFEKATLIFCNFNNLHHELLYKQIMLTNYILKSVAVSLHQTAERGQHNDLKTFGDEFEVTQKYAQSLLNSIDTILQELLRQDYTMHTKNSLKKLRVKLKIFHLQFTQYFAFYKKLSPLVITI